MAVFNRILNIIVMLMAIFAVVVAWKLYDRRKELRARGDMIADAVVEAAEALDANSPETVAGELQYDMNLGANGLGWQEYHKDPSQYKRRLEDFVTHARKITKHRDALSQHIIEIGKEFEANSEKSDITLTMDALNDPDQAGEKIAQLRTHMKTFYDRAEELTKELANHAQLIDENFDKSDLEGLRNPERYRAAVQKVSQGITRLNDLYDRYSKAMVDIVQKLTPERLGGVTTEDVKEIKPATVVTLLRGIDKVVDDLHHLALLQKQVKSLNEQIAKLKGDIEEANDTIQRQKTQIDTRDKQIVNLKNKIIDLEAIIDDLRGSGSGVTGDTAYDGKVVKVNYDFNYVIITLDEEKDKVSYGVPLTVARDREYICKVKVTKLFKNYAVAEILTEDKVGEVLEGDRVVWLD